MSHIINQSSMHRHCSHNQLTKNSHYKNFPNLLSGDVHLVQELQLANDNLRWRLEQRGRALEASKVVINSLRGGLEEAEARAAAAEAKCVEAECEVRDHAYEL